MRKKKKHTQKTRIESHAKLQTADFFFILPFLKVTDILSEKFTISKKKIIMQIFYRSFSIYNKAVYIKPVNNTDSVQELTVNSHL